MPAALPHHTLKYVNHINFLQSFETVSFPLCPFLYRHSVKTSSNHLNETKMKNPILTLAAIAITLGAYAQNSPSDNTQSSAKDKNMKKGDMQAKKEAKKDAKMKKEGMKESNKDMKKDMNKDAKMKDSPSY
jgi:hypothetical protein